MFKEQQSANTVGSDHSPVIVRIPYDPNVHYEPGFYIHGHAEGELEKIGPESTSDCRLHVTSRSLEARQKLVAALTSGKLKPVRHP